MSIEKNPEFETLKSRLQQDPDSLLFARVADGLLNSEQLDEAIRICEEGIRKHPYYVTGHMVLGKCYLKKKLFDLAEKEFKRVILFDPKYIAAHKFYGDLMREVGWDNTCEMSYRKILNIDPLDKSAREMLETLERIKPKEQKIVTPEQAPNDLETNSSDSSVDLDSADLKTATEPINLEDDLFSDINNSNDENDEIITTKDSDDLKDENDENVITTILEDIFEDSNSFDNGTNDQKEPDTIDELNIKISPRQGPKLQENKDSEKSDKDSFDMLEKFDEDTIEFNEMSSDINSIANKQAESAEDFDLEFISQQNEAEDKSESDDNFFDKLEKETDKEKDIFEQIDLIDNDESQPPSDEMDWEEKEPIQPPQKSYLEQSQVNANGHREDESWEEPVPVEKTVVEESASFEREKIVTPTLGEIYAAQGQYAKAINVFELLLKKDPANSGYREKISFLKKKMEENQNA